MFKFNIKFGKLCHSLLINPVEFKSQVHGAGHYDNTEVVNHEIGLGYGHHHPILLLEIVKHLREVEVCPALEEYNGHNDRYRVLAEEHEEVGHCGPSALGGLAEGKYVTLKWMTLYIGVKRFEKKEHLTGTTTIIMFFYLLLTF